jgi:hypothetical protein
MKSESIFPRYLQNFKEELCKMNFPITVDWSLNYSKSSLGPFINMFQNQILQL